MLGVGGDVNLRPYRGNGDEKALRPRPVPQCCAGPYARRRRGTSAVRAV